MSKKVKSKQSVRRKYLTAGALGYNQANYTANNFANPYATNPSYYDAGAAMAANQKMKSAMSASDVLEKRAREENKTAEEARKEREQQLKDVIEQGKQTGTEGLKGVGMEAAQTFGQEGIEKIVEKTAAKKAAKEAAKQAAKQAGTSVASTAAQQTGASIQQGVASTISSQAARGSGMEAARSLSTNLIDDTGAVTGNYIVPTAASTVGKAGLLGNMSGLASAGIGLGLTGAGMLIEHKTTDYDPTTFTEKERKGNLWGSAVKGAGSGFGYGAMAGSFLPGIGNVAGGIVGGIAGAGVGLVKGIKENKESRKQADEYAKQAADLAKEEKIRRERIAAESADIAGAYNSAFIQSRLSGSNQGIGYGEQNQAKTGGKMYGLGGYSVPGGQVVPIGQGAVEFIGRKHSEGGILLDPTTDANGKTFYKTEVEHKETMDQVAMNEAKTGGKMHDYFFSAYLKLGGKSFAQRHKELIKSGASQAAIQDLAKKQEAVANKKGEKDRSPDQIAKYGGIHKYQTAGFGYTVPQKDEEYEVRQDALTNEIGTPDVSWHAKSTGKGASANGIMLVQSAVPGFDEKEKKAQEEAAKKKTASTTKSKSSKKKSGSKPELTLTSTEEEGYTDPAGYVPEERKPADIVPSLETFNPNLLFVDKGVGTEANKQKLAELEKERKSLKSSKTTNKKSSNKANNEGDSVKNNFVTPSVMAGLAQLIPAGYVLATPYKKTTPIDITGAEFRGQRVGVPASVRGATLGRQYSGAEKAAAIANAAALNKYIEGTNAGPGAIIGKLAVNAKLNEQLLKIQDEDSRANMQLRAKEAELSQAASTTNAQMAMQAASQTAENLQRASENLQKAKIFNAQMEMSEKQYADERKVGALYKTVRDIAGITGDVLSYRAQERLAKVIDETGSYDRFKLKELMDNDPAFANLTKDQKDKIAAQMDAQSKGTNKAQLGGTRRYTSRLGDLNRGKNKRNFNI
jgi:hypothetical protein